VEYLIDLGVDINKVDHYVETLLHAAYKKGHKEIVKYLVEHGAYSHIISKYGETPLMIAYTKGYDEIKNYLNESMKLRIKKKIIRNTK